MRVGYSWARRPLRLRTILLVASLIVLLLPMGGIFFFRIYESALVRETEVELISQAALLSSTMKHEMELLLPTGNDYGKPAPDYQPPPPDEPYTPVTAQIDLFGDPPRPMRPAGMVAEIAADPLAVRAGQKLTPVISDALKTTLSSMRILDFNGIVVAGSAEMGLSFAHLEEVRRGLRGNYVGFVRERQISWWERAQPTLASISRGTGIRVYVVMPIINEGKLWGAVYISRTPESILKALYTNRRMVLLAALAVVGVTLFLTLFIAWSITRPIRKLSQKARQMGEGDIRAMEPLDNPVTVEVAMLSESFSGMARRLHERSEYIRSFATHLSHEFKTPLTSIQGAAELMSEHESDMDPDRRRAFINNMLGDVRRLDRLVGRLLEMARADSVRPGSEISLLSDVLADLRDGYGERGLDIQCRLTGPGRVRMAPDNLASIFANLFENASQHGADQVTVATSRDGGDLVVTVADNGRGVSPANRDKVFTPFFTTRRDQGGTGLGLGIVQSLMDAHDGSIRLDEGEGGVGACFTLVFPE